jgi:sphingolipid delta-4 desaturase
MATEKTTKTEFTWSETDEPHATRRKLILAKHPEIKELFGYEPRTFWLVAAIFIAQTTVAWWIADKPTWLLLLVAYVFGGTVNHSLQLAVHELSHNLCWKTQVYNKYTAFFANLVTGFPSSITFQRYHMEHHQMQGVNGVDTDIPTDWEVTFFDCAWKKAIWMFCQPLFYALRPMIVKPKQPAFWEGVNWVTQMTFNALIVYFFGWRAFGYLIAGTLLGLGLHPTAGHFIAEHYEFTPGQETYSYYGPCNYVNFNVGYHNEHHDFPKIPWSNLPKVRKIAPEFYDHLPHYTSYISVIWNYITDTRISPASRVKRHPPKAGVKDD